MSSTAQGIPGLPDLTHPIELVQFGTEAHEFPKCRDRW